MVDSWGLAVETGGTFAGWVSDLRGNRLGRKIPSIRAQEDRPLDRSETARYFRAGIDSRGRLSPHESRVRMATEDFPRWEFGEIYLQVGFPFAGWM